VQGGRVGRATARYTVGLEGEREVTGSIVFGVVRERRHPRVGLIAATPDQS
jgi:hypothetical protein